jgi:ribosomal protein L35AE/L33A
MEGTIISFRRGRHTQHNNQFIVAVDRVDSRIKAEKMIGKKVFWQTKTGKMINGIITSTHGTKGLMRSCFEKGLPGDAVGTKVRFE